MRLIATRQPEIQQRLFEFLVSVQARRPRAVGPILLNRRELRRLYAQPDPQVLTLLQHCLDRLLGEISPKSCRFGEFKISAAVLGLAVAAHNTLPGAGLPVRLADGRQADPVETFTKALIATIPTAEGLPEMLLYHGVLRDVTPQAESWPQEMPPLQHELVSKSPLTTLTALDGYKNPVLEPLANELLKAGSPSKPQRERPQRRSAWSVAVERILAEPELAGWLRRQWLDLPETRRCCRNLGLILETLRRAGGYRDFVLEFYEAYERCRFRPSFNRDPTGSAGAAMERPTWPPALPVGSRLNEAASPVSRPSHAVFDVIAEHLLARGSSEAALRLNRWGNEYLLKFLPLIEIIIAEDRLPKEYRHLTPALVQAIQRLLPYTTWNIRQKIEFTPLAFAREVTQ